MGKLNCALLVVLSLIAGCKITEAPPEGGVRDCQHGFFAREGLAFSRLLSSPVQLPLSYAGLYSYYYDDGKPMRFGHTDPFSKGLCSLLHGSVSGPVFICEEICVGLAEILSTVQFNRVIYPWETYGFYERSWNLEQELEYINSPEMLEKRRQSRERLGEMALEATAIAVEVAGEAAGAAIEQSISGNAQVVSTGVAAPVAAPGGETARTGYAIIKGPSNLAMGKSARYQLCIGGKSVDCEWVGGTSLTVSQSGRVLAGNPPVKGGKYRATLKARYNGKEYTKTIYIVK